MISVYPTSSAVVSIVIFAGACAPRVHLRSHSRAPPQEQQEQERRKQILDQIMTVEARLRLSNIGASGVVMGLCLDGQRFVVL